MEGRVLGRWSAAPLRTQIAVLITTLTSLTLLVTFGVLAWAQVGHYDRKVAERLETEAEIIAAGSEATLVFDDAEQAHETLQALRAAPHIVRARLLRADGSELARYEADVDAKAGEDHLIQTYSVTSGDEGVGALELVAGRGRLYAALNAQAAAAVLALLAALLVTVVVSSRIGAIVAGPFSNLTKTARRIADAGDYSVRATASGTGEVGDFVTVFNDMIECVEDRDRALNQANQEIARGSHALAEASRRAGMAEMAVGVLHNVGNALTSVLVSAALVDETVRGLDHERLGQAATLLDGPDPAKRIAAQKYIRKMTTRQAQLIERVEGELGTLLSRLEHVQAIIAQQQDNAAGGSNVIQQVGLGDLAESALDLVSDSLERHGVDVLKEFDSIPPFPVDRHKVLQILVNLLNNAKQSIVAHGQRAAITVRVCRDGDDHALISVDDTGGGIAAQHLDRVFEAGFTTRKDGHGFGLHASANAAREMGGTLSAASDGPGRGASFVLRLSSAAQVLESAVELPPLKKPA